MRPLWTAVIAGMAVAAAGVVPVLAATSEPEVQPAATTGGVKIAYFTQWGIYQNGFYPKNLDTGGYARDLDYLMYAFGNVHPAEHTCFMANKAANQDENDPNAGDGAGDAFADYGKAYGADISVDGVADTWDQPLAGNFNQLKKIKQRYPHLKILISLGGWTYSKYFSDAAATAASREKFVRSCINQYIKGDLPVIDGRGGPGAAAGVFDGIDIDWEYPGAPGHVGNHYGPQDKANFTLLLAEFRRQLDAWGSANGKRMYLMAAVPAGQDKIRHIETDRVGQYLDYANVMSYDMHGGWEAQGPTNHQTPVYPSADDPMAPVPPGNGKYNTDSAVKAWINGDAGYGIAGGFPAGKLVIGYPFYYRGWTGVARGDKNGLYQSASGPAPGNPLSGNVAGVSFYKEIKSFVTNPSYTYWDDTRKASYFYNGSVFWSGENQRSIQAKADYQHCNGLAGAMMYSLEALDPEGTLFRNVVDATNGGTPGCSEPSPTPTTSPTTSPTSSPTASPTSSPPGGCTAPAWSATAIYTGGAVVSYNGRQYTAKWWTQGDRPDLNTGDGRPWRDDGPCGPTTSPTPSPTGSPTASPTASPTSSPTSSPTPSPTGAYPAWQANKAYAIGDRVTYGGMNYQCRQAHTSLPGWEPPNTPALWQQL